MVFSNEDATRKILLSADRGLLGQIPEPLRAFSFSFDQSIRTIWLRAEVDRELSEDEREDLAFSESEIAADNVLDPHSPLDQWTQTELAVVVVPPDQPLDPLPDGVVFLRAGERVPDGYAGAMPHPDSRVHLVPHYRSHETE